MSKKWMEILILAIRITFRIEECNLTYKMVHVNYKIGKREITEGRELPNQESIRTLGENGNQK